MVCQLLLSLWILIIPVSSALLESAYNLMQPVPKHAFLTPPMAQVDHNTANDMSFQANSIRMASSPNPPGNPGSVKASSLSVVHDNHASGKSVQNNNTIMFNPNGEGEVLFHVSTNLPLTLHSSDNCSRRCRHPTRSFGFERMSCITSSCDLQV